MSEELQEVIKNNPEWYKNLQYKDVKVFIKDNINSASRSFVAIGYYLKYVRDNQLFKEDGYQNIWEFAQNEFGFSQSWASRCMLINDRFSKDGNSPIIIDQYKGFDKSKLSEMLTLTDNQLERVTITTTVAGIKDIKRSEKSYATSHKELKPEESEPEMEKSIADYETAKRVAIWCLGYLWNTLTAEVRVKGLFDFTELLINRFSLCPPYIFISGDDRMEYMGTEVKIINQETKKMSYLPYADLSRHMQTHWNTIAVLKLNIEPDDKPTANDIPETVNDEPENVDNEPEIVNDVDKSDTETSESVIEEPESVTNLPSDECIKCRLRGNKDAGILECHPENGDHKCVCGPLGPDEFEADPVETVEADIIETLSTETKSPDTPVPSQLELAKEMLKQKKERLREFINVQTDTYADQKYIESRKVEVGALAAYIFELEGMPEPVKPVQPELPILKNNDQRKEFIDAYNTWPIWIDIKETGERYYRYDLTDKVAMVVKVSLQHVHRNYKETKDIEYGAEQYYLLGIKAEWHQNGVIYTEDASRTFYECSSNKSQMVDYLKYFQKKGVR